MIQTLRIRNYVLIEKLDIDFSKGLSIITGETGAGKSILLGALGLIMGDRAEQKRFFDPTKKCVIEAVFAVGAYDVKSFFTDEELDYDEEVIIRREISASGKSRAFINDTPVNLKVLKALTGALIDLHQQFDTLDINSEPFQLKMIDALAGLKADSKAYRSDYQAFAKAKRHLDQLREQEQEASKELDYLQFQFNELAEASLVAGEQEQLESEVKTLSNAEEIKRTVGAAHQQLTEGDYPIIPQLHEVLRELRSLVKASDQIAAIVQQLESQVLDIEAVGDQLEHISDTVEHDQERINEVQNRLDTLYRLLKKHHVETDNELLAIQHDLESRLGGMTTIADEIARLEKGLDKQEKALWVTAKQLHKSRQEVLPSFTERVANQLAQLGMPHAKFVVQLDFTDKLSSVGADEVQFLFTANKGGQLSSIKDAASGGELSRLTLVTKSLVASAIPLPTLIFDEIDAGVSGDVAQKMGAILRKLADEHQVIVITHSPQVAACADRHFFVYKEERAEKTISNLKELSYDDRIVSIATMLSQSPPSSSALENAKELINKQ